MIRRQGRAEPLSPEERRRSIIAAIIPLLVEHGASVTTKQMAEAAGIAEGTIFGVFPDKSALIREAVKHSMDPAPVQEALSEIPPSAPIETQMAEAGRILLERFEEVIALMSILRTIPRECDSDRGRGIPQFVVASNVAINGSLTELFENHRDQLRIEPARAAAVFRGLVFASGHPVLAGEERLSIDEIVGVLTSGILESVSAPAV